MQTVSDTLLITLGCSWTYGVGVCYRPGMTEDQHHDQAWDADQCDQFSFRGLLSTRYGWDTINLSSPGSSNQRQFRLLKEFLGSPQAQQVKQKYKTIVVLHGITATSRNEMYFVEEQQYVNWAYSNTHPDKSSFFVKYFYDHDVEVESLQNQMLFFNSYYRLAGFTNIWFDTFNHHNYKKPIDNLLGNDQQHRDMLSLMCLNTGLEDFDDQYHQSQWIADSNRVQHLVRQGYLNPFTMHPTKRGHFFMADVLDRELKKHLGAELPEYFRS